MDGVYAWLAEQSRAGRLPEAFAYPFITRGVLAVLILGPLLGGMSHLVVARRLAFLSTALGQAALTGITIGLALGEPIAAPYAGLFGFCLLAALGMVYVKRRSSLPPDTLIGVFMALTLGLGLCLLVAATQRFNIHQIEAVMFGSLLTVTDTDLALLLVVAAVVGGVLLRSYNGLLADSLDPRLARLSVATGADGRAGRGGDTGFHEYLFVLLLTLAITVSLKVIGALLVEALVVVPAAAARMVVGSTRGYLAVSILVAVAAGLAGVFISMQWRVPTGGAVVLALSVLFFLLMPLGRLLRKDG